MKPSRRLFLLSGLSGAAATTALGRIHFLAAPTSVGQNGLAGRIIAEFNRLPGNKALKIWSPASADFPEWTATLNPDINLFCGSSFKSFVLAECLRQVEKSLAATSKDSLRQQLNEKLTESLVLDESVYVPGAPVFNPPNLSGKVTLQTVLEAMISHSDNTATDMALKYVGVERVRQFIAAIGLQNSRIPTSIRQFFGYINGYPGWQTITWKKIIELQEQNSYQLNPIVNDQITMTVSPHDFVSFYSRALQGEFFKYSVTLDVFRAILSLADAISLTTPLGVNAFMKGGSIDFNSQHALCVAGGMWLPKRWVYFGMTLNWTDADGGPVAEVQQPFVEAVKTIFTSLRDGFGC